MQTINLDKIYDNLDKMATLKRYRPPTKGYFPTVAEINTYATSDDFEHMIPYLLWLDESLTPEDRDVHKEAVSALRRIVSELDIEEENIDE